MAIETGTRWMTLVFMVCALTPGLALWFGPQRAPKQMLEGMALLSVVGIWLVVSFWIKLRHWSVYACAVAGAVAGEYLIAKAIPPTPDWLASWPFVIILGITATLSVQLRGKLRYAPPLVIWLAGVGLRLVFVQDHSLLWRALVIEMFEMVGLLVSASMTMDGLFRCAIEADDITEKLLAQNAREEGARRLARERDAAERFIHDTVVHALRAVALPDDAVSAQTARAYCQQAILARQDESSLAESESLAVALQAVVDQAPVIATIEGTSPVLPGPETSAITTAVREALRNVKFHAGVDRATIRIDRLALGGVRVTVSDTGVGFSNATPYGHRGIRDVITGGMMAVGGSARVVSTPCVGTEVILDWQPASVGPSRTALLTELSDQARRTLNLCPLPWIMSTFGATLFLTMVSFDRVALIVAATMIMLAALTLGIKNSSVLSRSTGLLLWLTATAGTVINVFEIPIHGARDSMFPLSAAGAALLMFLVFFRPLRESIGAVVTYLIITMGLLLLRLGPANTIPEFLPSLCGQTAVLAVALALRFIVDGIGEDAQATSQQDHERATRKQASLVSLEAQERVRRLNPANAFLRRIAYGELTADDESVKQRAHLFELALRDELHLHGAVPGELSLILWRLREDGWQVTLNLTLAQLSDNVSAISTLLSAAEGNAIGRLTVSHSDGQVSLLAVPAVTVPLSGLPLGATVSANDEFSTWSLPALLTDGS
ncbi:MAG: sensor histidine kinase [Propionibacteriaceae bacterium]